MPALTYTSCLKVAVSGVWDDDENINKWDYSVSKTPQVTRCEIMSEGDETAGLPLSIAN